ncbi:hypothetical protein BGZ94_003105 [Podila epigama]|nr:hypothetical protein BGZ94_003105 [Podila epigama]
MASPTSSFDEQSDVEESESDSDNAISNGSGSRSPSRDNGGSWHYGQDHSNTSPYYNTQSRKHLRDDSQGDSQSNSYSGSYSGGAYSSPYSNSHGTSSNSHNNASSNAPSSTQRYSSSSRSANTYHSTTASPTSTTSPLAGTFGRSSGQESLSAIKGESGMITPSEFGLTAPPAPTPAASYSHATDSQDDHHVYMSCLSMVADTRQQINYEFTQLMEERRKAEARNDVADERTASLKAEWRSLELLYYSKVLLTSQEIPTATDQYKYIMAAQTRQRNARRDFYKKTFPPELSLTRFQTASETATSTPAPTVGSSTATEVSRTARPLQTTTGAGASSPVTAPIATSSTALPTALKAVKPEPTEPTMPSSWQSRSSPSMASSASSGPSLIAEVQRGIASSDSATFPDPMIPGESATSAASTSSMASSTALPTLTSSTTTSIPTTPAILVNSIPTTTATVPNATQSIEAEATEGSDMDTSDDRSDTFLARSPVPRPVSSTSLNTDARMASPISPVANLQPSAPTQPVTSAQVRTSTPNISDPRLRLSTEAQTGPRQPSVTMNVEVPSASSSSSSTPLSNQKLPSDLQEQLADLQLQVKEQAVRSESLLNRVETEARRREEVEKQVSSYQADLQSTRITVLVKDLECRRAEVLEMMARAREERQSAREEVAKARQREAEAQMKTMNAEAQVQRFKAWLNENEARLGVSVASVLTALKMDSVSGVESSVLAEVSQLPPAPNSAEVETLMQEAMRRSKSVTP